MLSILPFANWEERRNQHHAVRHLYMTVKYTTRHDTYMFAALLTSLLIPIARVLKLLPSAEVFADERIRPATHDWVRRRLYRMSLEEMV